MSAAVIEEPLIPSSLIPMAFANGFFLMALSEEKLCPWLGLQKYFLILGIVSLGVVVSEKSIRRILFWMDRYDYKGTFFLTCFTVWTYVLRALQIGIVAVMSVIIMANLGRWQYNDKSQDYYCELGTMIFVLGAIVTCLVVLLTYSIVKVILAFDTSPKVINVVDYVILSDEEH